MKIDQIQHPDYTSNIQNWHKWRLCYEGGDMFKNTYLKRLSSRETTEDFDRRKEIAPIPRFSGAAVDEVANSITVRLPDVKRVGGSESYRAACDGKNGGVDRRGLTMNGFMALHVLPEMLSMRECLVFVDRERIAEGGTKKDEEGKNPYLYYYAIEDLVSWDWRYHNGKISYKTVLLKEHYSAYDEKTGLPCGTAERYLRMWINDAGFVNAQYFTEQERSTESGLVKGFFPEDTVHTLKIKTIPIAQFCISKSLLQDTADHQIALLNMESTDVSYAYGANFPFYVEEYDPLESATHMTIKDPVTGEEKKAKEKVVGPLHGRQYAKGLKTPDFIHPSPEPLEVSMKKQKGLKDDIRTLMGLSVATLQPGHASAESKGADNQTLEAGLAVIGLVLQIGEQRIAQIWSEYTKDEITDVIYPTNYTLVTEPQRQDRAKNYKELQGSVPSKTFQKEVAKEITRTLLEGKIPQEKLEAALKEVDAAKYITSNSEDIQRDLEMGIVSEITASEARGYDGKTEVPTARKEHAERAQRILLAQTSENGKAGPNGGGGSGDPAARGVADLSANSSAGKDEKTKSQAADLNVDHTKKVRS